MSVLNVPGEVKELILIEKPHGLLEGRIAG